MQIHYYSVKKRGSKYRKACGYVKWTKEELSFKRRSWFQKARWYKGNTAKNSTDVARGLQVGKSERQATNAEDLTTERGRAHRINTQGTNKLSKQGCHLKNKNRRRKGKRNRKQTTNKPAQWLCNDMAGQPRSLGLRIRQEWNAERLSGSLHSQTWPPIETQHGLHEMHVYSG